MKKQLLPVLVTISTLVNVEVSAQLTVKGTDAFVYVGNELLFVKQDVNLDNGNLYLRKDGQLIQGANATGNKTSANKGTGQLSVFVKSKNTNKFNYTSYGIPVSQSNGVVGNNGVNARSLINVPSTVTSSNPVTYAGDSGTSLNGGIVQLDPRFVAWYGGSNSNAYGQWRYPINNATNVVVPSGYGLYFKGTTGSDSNTAGENTVNRLATSTAEQRFDFRGVPNDGDINLTVAPGSSYLVGNPYPSVFDLNQFMEDNVDVIENVQFYEELHNNTHMLVQYQYGYGTYTKTTLTAPGTYTPPSTLYKVDGSGIIDPTQTQTISSTARSVTQFLPIGKGFWVDIKANATGPLKFRNTQRVYLQNQNTEFRNDYGNLVSRTAQNTSTNYPEILNIRGIDYTQYSKSATPAFDVTMSDGQLVSNITLIFHDQATVGYKNLEDAKISSETSFFAFIQNDDKKLNVTTQPFNLDQRFPFNIKSDVEKTVDIKVNTLINFDLAEEIYLHDLISNTYYDIKNNVAQITVPSGLTSGKYEITFKRDTQLGVDQNFLNNAFVVFQNNTDKMLTISNKELLDITSLEIYDIQGKLMLSKISLGTDSEFKFSTSSYAEGIYIVNVNTNLGKTVSKKVVIKN